LPVKYFLVIAKATAPPTINAIAVEVDTAFPKAETLWFTISFFRITSLAKYSEAAETITATT